MKIYIIVNDANILYSLQAKLNLEGYNSYINQGTNQAEIISEARSIKPDYIILDLILPSFDGFTLLEFFKSEHDLSGIPIFIFTDLSDNNTRSRADKLGANYFFLKSAFNLDEFIASFKKVVKNSNKIL
jgi:DNA-binding response OmpR family regulator